MTTVAITSPLPGRAEEFLAERFEVRIHDGPALLTQEAVADFFGAADGAVTVLANPITRLVFESCPSLRVVGNVAVGFDNIDIAAAEERGVWITNTPDVLTEATADLAWALVLAVTRRLREMEDYVRSGSFRGWGLDLLLGTGLQGKTMGIVGYGRIGRAVARRALASGMTVAYTDLEPHHEPDPEAEFFELEELLSISQIVSLHAPLTENTRHLIDEERLLRMPTGAVLVNTARGPLVDEEALVKALEAGHLGGAGLDVFEHEPHVHPSLLHRNDVVLLPHVGSATVETRAAMAELAAHNVAAVLEGNEPPTPVVRGLSL